MNKKIVEASMAVILTLLVIGVTVASVASDTGMMSYLVKVIGGVLAFVAFLRPKTGAYILLFEAFLVDAVKRYAVYYGVDSIDTVIEVMVVQMLAVVALILAIFARLLFGKIRFNWPIFSFFVIGLICAGAKLVTSDAGMSSAVKDAFNLGAYIALAFIFYHLFVDLGLRMKSFFTVMLLLAVASCLVALRQSYWGFSDVEDYYMHTFLSPVASGHYMRAVDSGVAPRGFGLASGVMNFVSMSGLAVYASFSMLKQKGMWQKLFYLAAYLIICLALFEVRMKTGLVIALAAPVAVLCARSSKLIYASAFTAVTAFVLMVVNSVELRNNIADIDYAFRDAVGLSDSYTIQTFEARLYSYSQMLDGKNWTPMGVDGPVETHDMVTYVLMSYGYIPFFGVLVMSGGLFLYFVGRHRRLNPQRRRTYLGFLTMFGLLFFANVVGGSNLHSNPVNFVLWTSLAAVLALGWGKTEVVEVYANEEEEPNPS